MILEEGRGVGGRGRERERERERNVDMRDISRLALLRALTGDQTHNLLVYGMMLQPTEPPSQNSSLEIF